MRHGIVILPQFTWPEARPYWQRAEELGFDHAWTYDHLSWTSLADQRWMATIPTLTAAATATSTIRLGTFVTSPNFRHPVPFAKDLATVDDISGGRFLLGVGSGAGGDAFDAQVLGTPDLTPRQRHDRFVEFVRGLDALLRGEKTTDGVSFDGDWFTSHRARMVGTPAQTPRMPFVIAADGPKGLKLVAELGDGWVTLGPRVESIEDWWRGVTELSTRLDDALAGAGRASIDRYLSLDASPQFALESIDSWEDAVGRAADLGFTDVVAHWPRPEGAYAGREEVLVEAASRFAR